MKKIINPYLHLQGYNCFGCAPHNPLGVHMEFYEDGDDIVSHWTPGHNHQGWLHTLHGGIQATLLDELCGWVVMRKCQTAGVTMRMTTQYKRPVSTLGGTITPIGASANIATIGILRRDGYEVKNSDFFRIGIPFTFAAVLSGYLFCWFVWGI